MDFLEAMAADALMMLGAEFSEAVVFYPPVGSTAGPVSVNALFDLTYEEVDLNSGASVQSQTPRVSVWAPLVPWGLAADNGQVVNARGVRYVIRKVERQGDIDPASGAVGQVVILLNKARP